MSVTQDSLIVLAAYTTRQRGHTWHDDKIRLPLGPDIWFTSNSNLGVYKNMKRGIGWQKVTQVRQRQQREHKSEDGIKGEKKKKRKQKKRKKKKDVLTDETLPSVSQ